MGRFISERAGGETNHACENVVLTFAEITHDIICIRRFEARRGEVIQAPSRVNGIIPCPWKLRRPTLCGTLVIYMVLFLFPLAERIACCT